MDDIILEEIIEKAVKNGFLVPKDAFNYEVSVMDLETITIIWDFYQKISPEDEFYEELHEKDGKFSCESGCCGTNRDKCYSLFEIIFSHDFAKAFWPDNKDETFIKSPIKELVVFEKQKSSWKFHLKQMVLCEEPLSYLEKFL